MATKKQLETKAKRLAKKFYDDAQALFDHDDMTVDIADDEVFMSLLSAQREAEDCCESSE